MIDLAAERDVRRLRRGPSRDPGTLACEGSVGSLAFADSDDCACGRPAVVTRFEGVDWVARCGECIR